LVAEIEVRGFLGPVDAEREAGLGVEAAGVEGRDDEWLRPRACEVVGAEGDDVYMLLVVGLSEAEVQTHYSVCNLSCGS
jgi:hypothetical protein